MTVGAIAGLFAARIPSPGFLIALVVAGLSLYGGRELRRLTPRGRLIQTVLMAFFTLGAFLNPAVLFWDLIIVWALWSTQGRVVFSAHYREVVIPATPEVKYRPSILIWAGGIAIVLLVGLLIAGLVAERFHH